MGSIFLSMADILLPSKDSEAGASDDGGGLFLRLVLSDFFVGLFLPDDGRNLP